MRFLTVSYLTLAVLYLAGDGKAYYLASLYPALLGGDAIPAATWALRRRVGVVGHRYHGLRMPVLVVAVVVSALISGFVALPLLPAADLRGSAILALDPDQGETVGWPDFIHAVTAAWRSIPADHRGRTVIVTDNYGEAGAIDLLAAAPGCPAPTAVTTATPPGVSHPRARPASCWSATTRPPRPPPTSSPVPRWAGSKTPPAWTIKSTACRCCSAARHRRGPGCGGS